MNFDDAGDLRERLAEIRSRGFLSLRLLGTERRIVTRLAALTGFSPEEIRATADEDGENL